MSQRQRPPLALAQGPHITLGKYRDIFTLYLIPKILMQITPMVLQFCLCASHSLEDR